MSLGLPSAVDRFVGREPDIRAVSATLRTARLVTLLGPGGVGKTRLALELARRRRGASSTFFVDLSSIGVQKRGLTRGPDHMANPLPPVVARAVGANGLAVRTVGALVSLLRQEHALLLLDNCEHLVDAVATTVQAVLDGCPGIRVLASSRESLRIPGETVWTVRPLPLEDAVRLFVDRAERVRAGATRESDESIAAICRRLEGVPLAIELAAAHSAALSPAEILSRLTAQLDDPPPERRGVPSRQRSLRDTIQWSLDLVSAEERAHFYRLAVFPGTFSLEAAEDVAGVDATALGQLVSKSLVSVTSGPLGIRYGLLEMLRVFGAAEMRQSGQDRGLRGRHLAHFTQLARQTYTSGSFGGSERDLQVLGQDLHNLRAALEWSLTADVRAGALLAGCSREVWLRYDQAQGLYWTTRLLALHPEADEARCLALLAAGALSIAHQEHATAVRWLAEAADVGNAIQRADLVAAAHHYVGTAAMLAQDLGRAEAELTCALELFRSVGDPTGEGRGLGILGVVRFLQGDLPTARTLLDQALSLVRAHGDVWGSGQALTYLGLTARAERNKSLARSHLEDAIRTLLPTADLTILGIALACLAAETAPRNPGRALRMAGAAMGLRRRSGGRYPPWTVQDVEGVRAAGAVAVGAEAAASEFSRGEGMTREQLASLLAGHSVKTARAPGSLSTRQDQVVRMVVSGMTNAEVAAELHLSERTVENHVFHALSRLGLHSRVQLATWLASHA